MNHMLVNTRHNVGVNKYVVSLPSVRRMTRMTRAFPMENNLNMMEPTPTEVVVNKNDERAQTPPVYKAPNVLVQEDDEEVVDAPTNPYAAISWQILVFLVQNGFSIFFAVMILVSFYMQRNAMNRQSQFFGKQPKAVSPESVNTTFADVAGCENAKLELQEIVDFLKSPEKYARMGAKIPKGGLLTGGPGLGKTLLARAVAGEADVPFFACSASEFIELFVGMGSARVRDLFKKAKECAPCIIFIDEIDAIGKSRASTPSFASNDEREQTINQLLTEMDGFEDNKGIVVLAATNRPEILDKALVRPGRFDRQITLDPPSKVDREAILNIHCIGKPLSPDVILADIAGLTVGFSGAELANICNEAAILAARANGDHITSRNFLDAIDRVVLGPEKKRGMDLVTQKKLVACHEAGHAVTAMMLDPSAVDKVTKISIIPRGRTGGVTVFEPLEDVTESGLLSRDYLENKLVVALGGRAAEEIVYGEQKITTGASSDMQVVQQIARMMVANYGFGSESIGPVAWEVTSMQPSAYMQTKIDKEVVRLSSEAYAKAKTILLENEELFTSVAKQLYTQEVLNKHDIEVLLHKFKK